MNQIQQLIDTIRNAPHDAIVVAGILHHSGPHRALDRQPYAPPGARVAKHPPPERRWVTFRLKVGVAAQAA